MAPEVIAAIFIVTEFLLCLFVYGIGYGVGYAAANRNLMTSYKETKIG